MSKNFHSPRVGCFPFPRFFKKRRQAARQNILGNRADGQAESQGLTSTRKNHGTSGEVIPSPKRDHTMSVLLTSPAREDPLQVDIDVEPQPLVRTPSGEHFRCMISIIMKERAKRAQEENLKRKTNVTSRYEDLCLAHNKKLAPRKPPLTRREKFTAHRGTPPQKSQPPQRHPQDMRTPKSAIKRRNIRVGQLFDSPTRSSQPPPSPSRRPHESIKSTESMGWETPSEIYSSPRSFKSSFSYDDTPRSGVFLDEDGESFDSGALQKSSPQGGVKGIPNLAEYSDSPRETDPDMLNRSYSPSRGRKRGSSPWKQQNQTHPPLRSKKSSPHRK